MSQNLFFETHTWQMSDQQLSEAMQQLAQHPLDNQSALHSIESEIEARQLASMSGSQWHQLAKQPLDQLIKRRALYAPWAHAGPEDSGHARAHREHYRLTCEIITHRLAQEMEAAPMPMSQSCTQETLTAGIQVPMQQQG